MDRRSRSCGNQSSDALSNWPGCGTCCPTCDSSGRMDWGSESADWAVTGAQELSGDGPSSIPDWRSSSSTPDWRSRSCGDQSSDALSNWNGCATCWVFLFGVLLSKSGNKSLFKSMNGLFHTLSHASPLDIHKSNPSQASALDIHNSNLHLPCTVPGTNLSVATKRGLEYPQHIMVSVQTVPREDDRDVGLRVDTKA